MLMGGTHRSRGSQQYTFRLKNAGIITALRGSCMNMTENMELPGVFMIDRIQMWLVNSSCKTGLRQSSWPSEP